MTDPAEQVGSGALEAGATQQATADALGAVAKEKLELLMIVANKPGTASHEQADAWENELLAAIEGLVSLAKAREITPLPVKPISNAANPGYTSGQG